MLKIKYLTNSVYKSLVSFINKIISLFYMYSIIYFIIIDKITVIIPAMPIAIPLIAPSTSPISIALDVPTA
ncbi:hypothetical protein rsdtw13_31550 [Clostridium sp. TW13]|uniref:Uncharacterized protein n=1 Tax=Inconstantimicrobium mannanitabidum TaxID=1604901 RepID=A0ACB5RFQ9_9CLOT|nr:hypothetical protein rsdtw13_31550 [Clostridium sp. TW13]